jgi:4-hydroxy-tetrahydrodipicolinate reductase
MTTAIGLIGAAGRMGRALVDSIGQTPGASLAGGIDRAGHPDIGQPLSPDCPQRLGSDMTALAALADVLIDFTAPTSLAASLDAAVAAAKPIVIGTTGLESTHHRLIDSAAKTIPVLWSANMSLGINLLAALVRQAAQRLGETWDIEIVEMHHRHKVDAPSGTALLLGEAAAAGRQVTLADKRVSVRDGITGARRAGDSAWRQCGW